MQFDFLSVVVAMLDEAEIPHMLAGSMVSTFHGEPRMTRDIEMVIDRSARRSFVVASRPRSEGWQCSSPPPRNTCVDGLTNSTLMSRSTKRCELLQGGSQAGGPVAADGP